MRKKDNEDTIDIRQKILTAASSLMMEKGVKETSLKDIANAAGISKGTLYYYYSAKDDIIFDITDKHLNQITYELAEWISTIPDDVTPEQKYKMLIETVLNAETRDKLHLYLLSDAVLSDDTVKKRFKQRYEEWRNSLEICTMMGFKDENADYGVLACLTVAALDGLIIQKLVGSDDIPIDAIAKLLSKLR